MALGARPGVANSRPTEMCEGSCDMGKGYAGWLSGGRSCSLLPTLGAVLSLSLWPSSISLSVSSFSLLNAELGDDVDVDVGGDVVVEVLKNASRVLFDMVHL